jgi:hypothetical protein
MGIKMSTAWVTILLSATLVAPGAILAQEDDVGLEHLVIEMASTRAEHEAVARYYAGKAEEARGEMRRHEQMARSYSTSRSSQPQQMRNHCLKLVEKYGEIAAEYDELAKLHEEEAGNVP